MTLRLDEPFRWGGGAKKAVTGPGVTAYYNDVPLSSWANTPQKRAAQYLRAYKVGWFNKAERKISSDIALLARSVSPEDTSGDNEREVVEPDLSTPWERLDPIGQFLRLMERPNPSYTGRQLFQKTQIRVDMAGWAYWYLEGGEQGLPSAIYGISPARMWPSHDKQGNLLGWVMDADKPSGGTPFSKEEILAFTTATADDEDLYGVGVVEAVAAEVPLTEYMARHTADVLSTGGRMAGMIWPKTRALGPDEFEDAQRAWRNVVSDGNAAKRMLIFPEPMEWQQGASTPAEIGIPELATLNRDNILSAFPIAPEMLGVPMPAGLNASGETRRELKRGYWEDTIHNRVELLEDTIQVGLLSRYEEVVGGSWDFDITEPNLDDAGTLIEKSGALKALISLGFDPKESVSAAGLEHIKYLGPPPEPEVPAEGGLAVGVGDTSRRDSTETQQPIAKSMKAQAEEMRDRTLDRTVPGGKSALAGFLTGQQERLMGAIRQNLPRAKSARTDAVKAGGWWDAETEDRELQKTMRGIYVEVGRAGLQAVADSLDRFVYKGAVDPIIADLMEYGGERITDINAKTKAAVQDTLAEGTRRGYSLDQLIDGVPGEEYAGVKGAVLDNGIAAFDEYRAEMIARTETMLSYNRAAIQGYGQFGVEKMLAYDGDHDAECAARNGSVVPIDEALGVTDHPNGTLVWSPVVDKASHDHGYELAMKAVEALGQKPVINNFIEPARAPDVHVDSPIVNVTTPDVSVAPTEVTVNVPEQPAPIVNVEVPERAVTIEAAAITVNVPEQPAPNVFVDAPPPANVTVEPAQVTVNMPEQKPLNRVVHRDKLGQITSITDGT